MEDTQTLIILCLLGMLLLYAFWAMLVKWKVKFDFNKIKKICEDKKTDKSILYDAVDKINLNSKKTFAVVDCVDVSIGNCVFKLVKGTVSLSTTSRGYNFSLGPSFSSSQTFYACCLNSDSLAEAKRMTSLFEVIAEEEDCGILEIKSMRKLKEIQGKAQLLNN
jgi:hypothetical protein